MEVIDDFTLQQPSHRMQWLDAMRGMAMLMVIYTHQVLGSDLQSKCITVDAFALLMLPMFFFISGYLSTGTKTNFWIKGRKLAVRLLLPTVAVYLIHAALYRHSIDLMDQMKGGYWFLPTLFVMELLGYSCFKLIGNLSLRYKVLVLILIILVNKVFMSVAFRYGILSGAYAKAWQINLFCQFLTPFLMGAIVKYTESLISKSGAPSKYLLAFLITIFIIMCYLPFSMVGFIMPALGTWAIFILMKQYRNAFSSKTRIGRFLIFCGCNSLGLYLLHYFVLQSVICGFGPLMLQIIGLQNNPVMQLIILGFATMVNTLLTFVLIKIIEASPVLSLMCLGRVIIPVKE